MKVVVAYLMKPNRDPKIREQSLASIRNQTLWSAETPRTILRYPDELFKGTGIWQLFKICDLPLSQIMNQQYKLNSAIWVSINHAVYTSGAEYVCVWFDDVQIESDVLERAINILNVAKNECDLIGLPPIGGENNTYDVPMRWFVFPCAKWGVVPLSKLIEIGFSQLYVTGLWLLFGEKRSCFLRCNFRHLR